MLEALMAAAAALAAGKPIPEPAASWLRAGLGRYLAEGGTLDACLGLKPRQGGRLETPHALHRQRQRDAALCGIAGRLSGPVYARAGKLEALLRAADTGQAAPEIVGLIEQFGDITPRTKRSLAKILQGQTISARR